MNKAFSLAMALAIFPCLLSAQEFRVKPLFKGNAYANFVHYQGQLHFTRSNGNYGEWYKLEANGDTTFVDMGLNFDKIESLTVIDSCLFFGGRTSPDPYNYGIEPYCYCGDTARLIHNLTTGGATSISVLLIPVISPHTMERLCLWQKPDHIHLITTQFMFGVQIHLDIIGPIAILSSIMFGLMSHKI